MPKIDVTDETLEQLDALAKKFKNRSIDTALAGIVERFHNAYVTSHELPEGWSLRDDLTLADFEAYYEHWDSETPKSLWGEKGRAIRSAIAAGWFDTPANLAIEDANSLKPTTATKLKYAIDAHYMRLTTADPNE